MAPMMMTENNAATYLNGMNSERRERNDELNENDMAKVGNVMEVVETQQRDAETSAADAPKANSGKEKDGALPPLESLTCQLCNSYFNEPMTLPCMHSYCKGCLETYNGRALDAVPEDMFEEEEENENNATDNLNTDGNAKKKNIPPLQCMTCNDGLHLKHCGFFQEPFVNERLTRILRLLHESHILCQNCEQTSSEFRCNVCDAYTCENCYKKTHDAPIFKSHVPERLTHSEMTCAPCCESHQLNEIEYFTTEDELGVCQVCLLKGEFKGKEYVLISDVRKSRQEDIEQGVGEALLQRAALIEGRQEVERTAAELKANLDEQQAAVQANFAAIRAAVDERERETLIALDTLHNQKQHVLTRQLESIAVEKGRIEDGVKNVNLVLNHSNDLEVVYSSFVLQAHVANLADVPSTSPLPSTGSEPNHSPAVDAELPVILSDKVPLLVKAYASVADASFVEKIAIDSHDKHVLSSAQGTREQQEILKQVGGENVNGADYGCLIQ